MQTNTLRGKKQLLIGFTLFSMFFGAGNLIFPPYLGAQAGHPPHGQHLVCDAGAAGRGKHRAAVGLLPPVFCSGLSGGPAPGEADPAAGQNPLPRLAGPDPAVVCGLSAPPGSSRLRHPDRRLHRPARRAGHPGRLPDHGHSGRAEFRGGHCAEHPGPRCDRTPGGGAGHHPGRVPRRRAVCGGLRHAHPHRRHCGGRVPRL